MKKLIVATYNKGKLNEIKSILSNLPYEIISLQELGCNIHVIEDEPTFRGNALKKAIETMKLTGEIVMADDSGLEVSYLNGQPGVYSARFAGEGATDDENNAKLLDLLKDVPKSKRQAAFKCSIIMAYPDGTILESEGKCKGYITLSPRGNKGFGYDPIFKIAELGKTFAQLDSVTKNEISHRGRALRNLRKVLQKELINDI
ncbi:MAG: XTP/dITP diphosphatase [Clostridiales bacterium]|nr:XTP/dITP diphosphatase [Clostridiales bacterium]